jgi:hypothetical protein
MGSEKGNDFEGQFVRGCGKSGGTRPPLHPAEGVLQGVGPSMVIYRVLFEHAPITYTIVYPLKRFSCRCITKFRPKKRILY